MKQKATDMPLEVELLEACKLAAGYLKADFRERSAKAFVKGQVALKSTALEKLEEVIAKAESR